MKWAVRVLRASLVVFILLGGLTWQRTPVLAQSPDRLTTITVPYTEYEWWVILYTDNTILCQVLADHEGVPTGDEVLRYCGEDIYTQWSNTPACPAKKSGRQPSADECPGVYLFLASFQNKERQMTVELPAPVVYVTLEGCSPSPPENRCAEAPVLLLTGQEPLPNERITGIRGLIGGQPFFCDGDICRLQLGTTPLEGTLVEFWAESSFGDSSERFSAQVRVLDTGVIQEPGGGGYYVDVISSQWMGAELESCVRIWEAFPSVGGPPTWLTTPDDIAWMASGEPYYYLAGRLIAQGVVDASSCSTGGMQANGYADACGLDKSREIIDGWQDQFDSRIIEVARVTGVPAQLMKNLFAQESQFWPGVFRVPYEFGLGQITDNGAETVLLWNDTFFEQFCPLVLADDACDEGYLGLQDPEQALLRGAVATTAKADCPECQDGIDISNAKFSVSLFANTLKANCSQVGQIVYNATSQVAGTMSSYEDLWRFTIANYHAGPGCLSYAIHTAWGTSDTLNWENVSKNFSTACQGVVPYVAKITEYSPP